MKPAPVCLSNARENYGYVVYRSRRGRGERGNRISRYSRAVYDVEEEEEEEEEGDGEDGNKRVCVTNVTYAKEEGWKTGG